MEDTINPSITSNGITSQGVLQPGLVRTIREAFDDAVSELNQRRKGLNAPELPEDTRAALARRLVEMARKGECDFQRLRSAALSAVPL